LRRRPLPLKGMRRAKRKWAAWAVGGSVQCTDFSSTERPLSKPTMAVRPRRRERPFLPQSGRCLEPVVAVLSGDKRTIKRRKNEASCKGMVRGFSPEVVWFDGQRRPVTTSRQRRTKRPARLRLQLAFDLVEKAPVRVFCDKLLRARLNQPRFAQRSA
jgi:hypothetical protein